MLAQPLSIKPFFALAALLTLLFAGCVDLGIINLGLPIMAKALDLHLQNAQWIITIYFIASSAVMMASGSLGDNIGHKKVFLMGALVLFSSSLLIGFSEHPSQIIVGRFFQGLAFGIYLPTLLSIASHLFPDQHRGLVVGLLSTVTGLGLATGPVIGGYILELLHWQWLFWFNLPFCCLAFVLGIFFLPNTIKRNHKRIDWLGMGWLVLGSLSLISVISNFQKLLLQPEQLLIMAFFSVIFVWGFFIYQLKKQHPFIKLSMFENHPFSAICFIRFISQSIIYVLLFVLGLLLINIANFSPILAGQYLLIITGIYGVGSIIAGKLSDIYGCEHMILLGLIPLIAGCFWIAYNPIYQGGWTLVTPMILIGLHMATTPNLTALATKHLQPMEVGTGTGMFYTVGFFGSALGVALSGLCIAFSSFNFVSHAVNKMQLSGSAVLELYKAAQGSITVSSLPENLAVIAKGAFNSGVQTIAFWSALFSICCVVVLKIYLQPKK